jgi:hypothetical protein
MLKRRYLKKLQYFLMRHAIPLSPRDVFAFRTGPKVFANSIPKAGTNLLRQMLNMLPCIAPRWTYHIAENDRSALTQLRHAKRGQVVTAHQYWSKELSDLLIDEGFRSLFIIRDLRDVAVSKAFYITHKDPSHRLHAHYVALKTPDERLMASMKGVDGCFLPRNERANSIGEDAAFFLPWLDQPDCLVVRFEDLIGAHGGGTDETQIRTVSSIINHLGLDLADEEVRRIAANTFFKKSRTFRKGAIGDWKNHFTEEHKRVFKDIAGDALIEMGYEKGRDW